ncbi:MAG: hypothetical protein K2X81_29080, partial [Candidatus Obscuribacterales bacterium]|nr:hypothetical protein [Candidatus Obscuribacterales bacterium]
AGSTPPINFNGQIGGGQTALAKALMQPSYVGLATPPFGDVFGKPKTVEDIVNFVNDHAADSPRPTVPAGLLSKVDSPSDLTSAQAYQMKGMAVHQCNNTNVISGGPGPHDPVCESKYNKFLSFYGSQVPSDPTTANGLMAVEAFKCYVLQVRAGAGSDGCGVAVAPQACTGLKPFNIKQRQCLPCNFAQPGSLNQLLNKDVADGAQDILPELKVRMFQIKPTISEEEIANVLNTPVSMGQVSFIFKQGANLVLSSSPPSFPINAAAQPDGVGSEIIGQTGPVNLDGTVVNVSGEDCEGYPNPWDCPAVPSNGLNKIVWTPSSGFNNLLGVIRLTNCASGGGNWCCPC